MSPEIEGLTPSTMVLGPLEEPEHLTLVLRDLWHLSVGGLTGPRCGTGTKTIEEGSLHAYLERHLCARCVELSLASAEAERVQLDADWTRSWNVTHAELKLLRNMIAKARRLLRTYFPKGITLGNHNPGVANAYSALDMRARR